MLTAVKCYVPMETGNFQRFRRIILANLTA